VLITQEEAQADLAPSGWIPDRTHPCSAITFTLSLPVEQAHLLVFQLSGALSVVTEWGLSSSPLLTLDDHLVFRHLRSMLFDLITAVRLGAGGQADGGSCLVLASLPRKSDSCIHLPWIKRCGSAESDPVMSYGDFLCMDLATPGHLCPCCLLSPGMLTRSQFGS